MSSVTLCIWDHACLVKDPRITSPEQIPKQLEGYAHFSPKVGGCVYGLSKNNLWRIFNHYGRIPVVGGQQRLDDFKARVGKFQQMVKDAELIKSGAYDARFDDGYEYKLPPLGAYQDIGSRLLANVNSVPLFVSCGLGKTFMVLTAVERRIATLDLIPGKILVCGKLMTLFQGWEADCLKFTNLKPKVLWCGAKKNRKAKLIEMLNEPADVYIVNHDGLRVLEEALTLKRFQAVIVDESTILKSYRGSHATKGGAFGKALMGVSRFAHFKTVMSGTPAPNGAEDLWPQLHFLDTDGMLLEKSWSDFKTAYMDSIVFGNKTAAAAAEGADSSQKPAFVPEKWFVRREKIPEISALVTPLAYRARIRDHLKDLPAKTVIKRLVDMTPEQNQHYLNMQSSLTTIIEDERISVSVKLAQLMKLRQITSGLLIDEQEKAHLLPNNPKLEMIDQLLNEEIDQEDKVIIFAQYQAEIESLVSRYKAIGVYGGNSSATNLKNIEVFIKDPSVRTIVIHPKSAAHGITLVVAHYVIFAAVDYSYESYYQAVKRVERAGQKHPMFVYPILARGTIDEAMWKVIGSKGELQAELIDQEKINIDVFKEIRNVR